MRKKEKELKIKNVSKTILSTPSEDDGKTEWFKIEIDFNPMGYEINKEGIVRNIKTKEPLKRNVLNGYYRVIFNSGDSHYNIGIHRLLSCLFIPIPQSLLDLGYTQLSLVPNHIDGNRINNSFDNLEWVTPQQNMQHAMDSGLCDTYVGEKSHLSKITEKQVIEICELLSTGIRPREVSELLEVPIRTVRHIYSGECWKKISCNYDFKKESKGNPYTKPDSLVHNICKVLEEKAFSDPEIGKRFGVSREYVKDIRTHRRRTEISSNYIF